MSKPCNCQCGTGGFTVHGHKWAILHRRPWPGTSQFKCLQCGWKWWARKRYASRCPDHVEQSRTGMTDQDILERIEDGTLIVDRNGSTVWSVSREQGLRRLRIRRREHPTKGGSAYNFVEISRAGRKKKISLHRLVWMSENRRTVPDGYDVDHVNGKGVENADGIDNLRLLESSKNRGRGFVSSGPELPFDNTDEVPF